MDRATHARGCHLKQEADDVSRSQGIPVLASKTVQARGEPEHSPTALRKYPCLQDLGLGPLGPRTVRETSDASATHAWFFVTSPRKLMALPSVGEPACGWPVLQSSSDTMGPLSPETPVPSPL